MGDVFRNRHARLLLFVYFIESVGIGRHTGRNCFASAYETDLVVADILNYTASSTEITNHGKDSIWTRLGFGTARRAG